MTYTYLEKNEIKIFENQNEKKYNFSLFNPPSFICAKSGNFLVPEKMQIKSHPLSLTFHIIVQTVKEVRG